MEREYLSPEQAAQIVGVSAEKMRRWCAQGKLGCNVSGGFRPRYRIRVAELHEFMASLREPAPQQKQPRRKPAASGKTYF